MDDCTIYNINRVNIGKNKGDCDKMTNEKELKNWGKCETCAECMTVGLLGGMKCRIYGHEITSDTVEEDCDEYEYKEYYD